MQFQITKKKWEQLQGVVEHLRKGAASEPVGSGIVGTMHREHSSGVVDACDTILHAMYKLEMSS